MLGFVGAPIAHEDDPEQAYRAALDTVASAKQYIAIDPATVQCEEWKNAAMRRRGADKEGARCSHDATQPNWPC